MAQLQAMHHVEAARFDSLVAEESGKARPFHAIISIVGAKWAEPVIFRHVVGSVLTLGVTQTHSQNSVGRAGVQDRAVEILAGKESARVVFHNFADVWLGFLVRLVHWLLANPKATAR